MTDHNNTTGPEAGGIVLFAKRPGFTSFSSLFTIKHALSTSKVGHTGTLDSFASGLLVVCTGPLTRLAARITEFDKSYDAVIEFGRETDTLEWTGQTVRTAPLPGQNSVETAAASFCGSMMQVPPLFSALHVNGERASSIARSGRMTELPARPVNVFKSDIEEYLYTPEGTVQAVRIRFYVSKGTYIRSLARDIGYACGSAAHLAGLRRLSVGSFTLERAAGACLLEAFTIRSVYESIAVQKETALQTLAAGDRGAGTAGRENRYAERKPYVPDAEELALQEDVRSKLYPMTGELACECGFDVLYMREGAEDAFRNGKPLNRGMFAERRDENVCGPAAVFSVPKKEFLGMVQKQPDGRYSYMFVIYTKKT